MKTERSKQLLEQALRAMPQNFSLREVRYHMTRALSELQKIENKRAKRESQLTPRDKWELDLKSGKLVPPNLNDQQKIDYLRRIDELIAAEQAKIDSMNHQSENDLLTD